MRPSPAPRSPEPTATIWIVLGTHRGERWIDAQLESLRTQTHRDWRLLVRDDASDDGTPARLARHAARDERIEALEDDRGRLGVIGNYGQLLTTARERGASWIALCDQDDVWRPDKLARLAERIERAPRADGEPRLVHTDAEVVGPDLERLAPSLWRLMGLRPDTPDPLAALLIQNFVTGCTAIFDADLLEVALPLPDECVMTDWWLALCAAAIGRLECDPVPSLLYRQHGQNVLGARPWRGALFGALKRAAARTRHDPVEFERTLRQASALERRLQAIEARGHPRAGAARRRVAAYLDLYSADVGRARRVREMHRQGIRRQNPWLDALLKLKLLTTPVAAPERSAAAALDV